MTDNADRLAVMRSRLEMAMGAYSDSRTDELDDLRFAAGSPDNQWQWPSDVLSTRGSLQGQTVNARPCLTINKLPQHIRQVTNEQRQNRPAGKVIPADDEADVEVAEIFDGIVKHIEYLSDADVAYDTACDNQVTYGEGYIRILTEYCNDDSFDQDLKIGRIRNSFSVYMDPTIQDPCGSDAKWCFITEDLLKSEYELQFPDATPISTLMSAGTGDQSISAWLAEDTIRIAEYFYYDHTEATLNLYPGNLTALKGTSRDKALMTAFGGKPLKSRTIDQKKVMWVKTNGYEVLEENEWAGSYIPVVRVIGNEFEVEGQIYVSGLVRNAKDAQRMYNYWVSQEAEMLALAPKAPFIGYGGQFENYEDQWKTANTTNWPYLEVNPDVTDGAGAPLPLPQRSAPPMASAGLLQAKAGAGDDIKSTTGQYDASLGQRSNETSGKAIRARQQESDTSTYHFVDNLARAIRYITRQLVDCIPKIYDTERVARIVGIDGTVSMVKMNPSQPQAVNTVKDANGAVIEKIYNPTIGTYDVMVTTGPGYMSARQEALDSMTTLLQTNPQLWPVIGDLVVKNMDWPGAQEIADRLHKMVDPRLLADDQTSPELQQAQAHIQALTGELQDATGMIQHIGQSMEAQQLKVNEFRAEIEAYKAETGRMAALATAVSPEQIQDMVLGTVHSMIASGDLAIPNEPVLPPGTTEDVPPQPPAMPPAPPLQPQPGA